MVPYISKTVCKSLLGITSQYDQIGLKLKISLSDLYFLFQRVLPYILKTISCMHIIACIITQYEPTNDFESAS